MGVVQGFLRPWETGPEAALDLDAASLFLRAQASWLCRGLARATDPAALAIVLGAHDASHESWLTLIAAVQESLGDAAAQELAALYGFHGKVAGSLEADLGPRIEPTPAGEVCQVLGSSLRELTETAVGRLRAGASGAPPRAEAVRN